MGPIAASGIGPAAPAVVHSGQMGTSQNHWWRALVVAHALMVLSLTALFVVMEASTPLDTGANIGAGLVALPLLLLGLPWSMPFVINPYRFDDVETVAWHLAAFGSAALNVVLHALLFTVITARRRRRG